MEALDSLDGLVTDLNMPGVNGVEFAKFARDKGVPVIAVSAYLNDYTAERLRRAGIVCSIEKPFKAEELEEKAKQHFPRH
jgi:CheY-like chemotaxis protein